MTLKQYKKSKIGDKLTMFDGGYLLHKEGMNVIVRMRDTKDNFIRGRRYLVTNLIEQNGQLYINSDVAQYCRYEDSAMKVMEELKTL